MAKETQRIEHSMNEESIKYRITERADITVRSRECQAEIFFWLFFLFHNTVWLSSLCRMSPSSPPLALRAREVAHENHNHIFFVFSVRPPIEKWCSAIREVVDDNMKQERESPWRRARVVAWHPIALPREPHSLSAATRDAIISPPHTPMVEKLIKFLRLFRTSHRLASMCDDTEENEKKNMKKFLLVLCCEIWDRWRAMKLKEPLLSCEKNQQRSETSENFSGLERSFDGWVLFFGSVRIYLEYCARRAARGLHFRSHSRDEVDKFQNFFLWLFFSLVSAVCALLLLFWHVIFLVRTTRACSINVDWSRLNGKIYKNSSFDALFVSLPSKLSLKVEMFSAVANKNKYSILELKERFAMSSPVKVFDFDRGEEPPQVSRMSSISVFFSCQQFAEKLAKSDENLVFLTSQFSLSCSSLFYYFHTWLHNQSWNCVWGGESLTSRSLAIKIHVHLSCTGNR